MKQYVQTMKIVFILTLVAFATSQMTEDEATIYLEELNERLSSECNANMVATWNYVTDVSNETAQDESSRASVEYLSFRGEVAENVSQINYGDYGVEIYRQFRFLADQGPGGLDRDSLERYEELQSSMEDIYNNARLCKYEDEEDCSLQLEPDLEAIMATSTDWNELEYYWNQWRDNTGKLMRESYLEFAQLSNEAAVNDGYSDTGDYWLNGYTVTEKEAYDYSTLIHTQTPITADDFREMASTVLEEVTEKLYKKLHSFVRMKLKQNLYADQINSTGPLPAHIMGNMWAQDWTNIAQYVMPFEDQPTFDVTQSMLDNNWNIDQMFEAAEDFFTSIGLYSMTDDFKEKTVNNQTKHGKPLECHASAEDFCLGPNSTDFRIKMCTEVNMADLVTVHHEMGHIEYFMAYSNLSFPFREAANPGFHEAIGDLIALSVSTPQHLQDVLGLTASQSDSNVFSETESIVGLEYSIEEKNNLNFLMMMALQKIAFLPFGYLIDQYRWGIFDGSITSENLNTEWWRLREELQGIMPPSGARGEENFDAGAKFHLPANVPYIRYFAAFILQFQFHQHLCESIGVADPLYECDIYGQKQAGNILKAALQKGLSEPWPLVLYDLGGTYQMDASSIISYFQPLLDYFDTQLQGECIGWGDDCLNQRPSSSSSLLSTEETIISTSMDISSSTDQSMTEIPVSENPITDPAGNLEEMEKNITVYAKKVVNSAWNFHIDASNNNEKQLTEDATNFDVNYRMWWEEIIRDYDVSLIEDDNIRRQYEIQQSIGSSALNDTQLLNRYLSEMKETYSNKICPYDGECKSLSDDTMTVVDISNEMTRTTDYSELSYYWAKWRAVTGQAMYLQQAKIVEMLNRAAVENGFKHAGEMELEPYIRDDHTIEDITEQSYYLFWNVTYPVYQKLHAYVRYKLELNDDYKDRINDENRLLPVNMLGDLIGYSWENLYDVTRPYGSAVIPEISGALRDYSNATNMFEMAENFYHEIGMESMTEDFKTNSVFETPEEGDPICFPRNWDFYTSGLNKYRISMCTEKTQSDFLKIHRQMGQLENSMLYYNQPLAFRRPANPGFPIALGGAVSLSVATPSHLNLIYQQLNPAYKPDELTNESKINFLFKQALSLLPSIAYSYAVQEWKWKVYTGDISPDVYNKEWWKLSIDCQGVKPPISRQPGKDFDIGADYHIGNFISMERYFFGSILQFQFHEKMCELAGNTEEYLALCDVMGTRMVGYRFNEILSQGASTSWESQLFDFLGIAEIDGTAMLKYFDPLIQFLDEEITKKDIEVGWESSDTTLSDYIQESTGEISAAVPIVVGIVFAIMVIVVIVAFLIGQKRNKRNEEKAKTIVNGTNNVELDDNMTNIKIPRITVSNGQNGKQNEGTFTNVVLGDEDIPNRDAADSIDFNDSDVTCGSDPDLGMHTCDLGDGSGKINAAFTNGDENIAKL